MALVDTTWYCNFGDGSTTGHYAVAKRAASTAVTAATIRRQFTTPTVNLERCFICIIAGTTSASADATWVTTRGAKTTDGTVTWMECTGQAALNGDNTNVATWAQVKAATPAVLGQIIKRSNNASYQICTTAGAMSASEPAFSDTAGTTTTDTTAVWTSLGPVSNFTTGGAAPFARLTQACASTWCAAGNTVYVGHNHAETQSANLSVTTVGAATGVIVKVLCHNSAGSYPPTSSDLATSATVSTAGNWPITITIGGSVYVYGIIFRAGVGGTSSVVQIILTSSGAAANQGWMYFDNCSFRNGSTSPSANMQFGTTSAGFNNIVFNNCTVSFGNVAQYIYLAMLNPFIWKNTGQVLVGGSSVPTTLFQYGTGAANQNIALEALDLSQLTGSLFGGQTSTLLSGGTLLIKDCKLNATTTVGTPFHTGMTVQLVRCDA